MSLCSDYDNMGKKLANGCFDAIQYTDFSGHAQGPAVLGVQTLPLKAALGQRRPTDADTCPPTPAYVIARCPGAPAAVTCTAGVNALSGRAGSCCACRRTRLSQPYTTAYESLAATSYYGVVPNCKKPYRSLLAGAVVHFTGALLAGNPRLGCATQQYSEIVMEAMDGDTSPVSKPYWVLADSLTFCSSARTASPNAGQACGAKAELGGYCDGIGCCTVVGQGGHPKAQCLYPPDVQAPSACVIS